MSSPIKAIAKPYPVDNTEVVIVCHQDEIRKYAEEIGQIMRFALTADGHGNNPITPLGADTLIQTGVFYLKYCYRKIVVHSSSRIVEICEKGQAQSGRDLEANRRIVNENLESLIDKLTNGSKSLPEKSLKSNFMFVTVTRADYNMLSILKEQCADHAKSDLGYTSLNYYRSELDRYIKAHDYFKDKQLRSSLENLTYLEKENELLSRTFVILKFRSVSEDVFINNSGIFINELNASIFAHPGTCKDIYSYEDRDAKARENIEKLILKEKHYYRVKLHIDPSKAEKYPAYYYWMYGAILEVEKDSQYLEGKPYGLYLVNISGSDCALITDKITDHDTLSKLGIYTSHGKAVHAAQEIKVHGFRGGCEDKKVLEELSVARIHLEDYKELKREFDSLVDSFEKRVKEGIEEGISKERIAYEVKISELQNELELAKDELKYKTRTYEEDKTHLKREVDNLKDVSTLAKQRQSDELARIEYLNKLKIQKLQDEKDLLKRDSTIKIVSSVLTLVAVGLDLGIKIFKILKPSPSVNFN